MADGIRAGRMPIKRNRGSFGSETTCVYSHPFQRRTLIKQVEIVAVAITLPSFQYLKIQRTENTEPVIRRDEYNIRMSRNKRLASRLRTRCVAYGVRASVQPEQYPRFRGFQIGYPYVEIKAILAHGHMPRFPQLGGQFRRAIRLNRGWRIPVRQPPGVEGVQRLRR